MVAGKMRTKETASKRLTSSEHDEMAPAMQSLNRKLDKAGNNAEERERILKEFGKEMGRLVLTHGKGRGGARKGGRSAAGGNLRPYRSSRGGRRQSG